MQRVTVIEVTQNRLNKFQFIEIKTTKYNLKELNITIE